ncbi:MAG: phosphoribosylformylglycinamidine synthase subunit PurS, partial [Planctomycetales bacterium]
MLCEIEIHPAAHLTDREGERVLHHCHELGGKSIHAVRAARSFLIQGTLSDGEINQIASGFLVDPVVETHRIRVLSGSSDRAEVQRNTGEEPSVGGHLLNVMFKPGVTDNVASSVREALLGRGYAVDAVRTCHKYWFNVEARESELKQAASRVLANDAIQQVVWGPLRISSLSLGSEYRFHLVTVPLRSMTDDELVRQSKAGQLYLSLTEMQTIRQHYLRLDRDPTDIELETIAQTWSEHCSHKTLRGRVRYVDEQREV